MARSPTREPAATPALILRPWPVRVATGAGAVAAVTVAVAFGWFFGLIGALFVLLGIPKSRQSLRLDEGGVRWRDLWPPADFHLPWAAVARVVLDHVQLGAPGSGRKVALRVRWLTAGGPPRQTILFLRSQAEPLVAHLRSRGVEVLDERRPPSEVECGDPTAGRGDGDGPAVRGKARRGGDVPHRRRGATPPRTVGTSQVPFHREGSRTSAGIRRETPAERPPSVRLIRHHHRDPAAVSGHLSRNQPLIERGHRNQAYSAS